MKTNLVVASVVVLVTACGGHPELTESATQPVAMMAQPVAVQPVVVQVAAVQPEVPKSAPAVSEAGFVPHVVDVDAPTGGDFETWDRRRWLDTYCQGALLHTNMNCIRVALAHARSGDR